MAELLTHALYRGCTSLPGFVTKMDNDFGLIIAIFFLISAHTVSGFPLVMKSSNAGIRQTKMNDHRCLWGAGFVFDDV